MINANSVKGRLKNLAKNTGKTMQDALVLYGLERTIYRISISEYSNQFTLKGGIFLYALFSGDYARATTDIDLSAQQIPNDIEEMKGVFTNILSLESDDALQYDLNTLEVINITEFKKYHGVKVKATVFAYLDKTRIPISIDVGFGDVIYPDRVMMEFPTLLDMEAPNVFAYSLVSAVAEKFEAFVSLGLANSRYKDFYDIYVIATQYNIDGSLLQGAIVETFKYRETKFEDIVAFEEDFVDDAIRNNRWNAFIKKKKAMLKINLRDTLDVVKNLLIPVVNAIEGNQEFRGEWKKEDLEWHIN